MLTLLSSFFSFIVGLITSNGLGMSMLWSTLVSLGAYFAARQVLRKYITTEQPEAKRGLDSADEPRESRGLESAALREEYSSSGYRGTYLSWLEARAVRSRELL